MSRDFTQAEGTELRLRKVLSAMTAVNSLRHSPRLRQAATTVASVLAALACLCGFTFSAAAPPAVADPCGSQCGGGGNGGPDSGGGSQFQPPGMPSVPPNAANHGYYPAPDQANGISIYNWGFGTEMAHFYISRLPPDAVLKEKEKQLAAKAKLLSMRRKGSHPGPAGRPRLKLRWHAAPDERS